MHFTDARLPSILVDRVPAHSGGIKLCPTGGFHFKSSLPLFPCLYCVPLVLGTVRQTLRFVWCWRGSSCVHCVPFVDQHYSNLTFFSPSPISCSLMFFCLFCPLLMPRPDSLLNARSRLLSSVCKRTFRPSAVLLFLRSFVLSPLSYPAQPESYFVS